jgi:dipeptidyl aminopeptidase/acylaminoacyl peptidase
VPAEADWRLRFRAPTSTMPQWARDAPDRLLFLSNASGRFELCAWDRASGETRRVTDRPAGTTLGAIEPGGRTIWWFDDDMGGEFGTWRAEPFAGGSAPWPAAPGVEPGFDAGLALGSGFAIVGLSTDRGSRIWLAATDRPAELLYTHREDAEVAGLSRDERLLAMCHAEHGDSRHPALRVVDRTGRTVAGLADGPGLALRAGAWSPVPGDQRLVVVHDRTGNERPAIWEPEAGRLVELHLDLPGDVDAGWYPDAGALLLSHRRGGRVELYRHEPAAGRTTRLEAPPGWIAPARVRPDGRVWYRHSSGATPPRLLEDGRPLLATAGAAPPGVPYHDLRVGRVPGFLALPAGAGPHPTVVLVHGGPTSPDRDSWSPEVQAWVDHGFAVALVNYRGSGGHGREWRDALEGNPGLTEIEDLRAVRDHLVASRVADPARLVLAGTSWGGYLTLLGLGRQPEAWSLGVALVPVADYVTAFEDEMEPLKAFDRSLFGGTPAERPDFYRERSPITYAERLRVPVLVTAGRNDPRCPIRQVQRYLARLRELGKPHEYYEHDAGHASMVVDEQIRQVERQLDFAHRHLGTPSPR